MTKSDFLRLAAENFEKNGISHFATDDILSKLYDLCGIFLETNKVMNLTAIKDEKLVISRHFADCLIPASLFPERTNVLDVGSGGGLNLATACGNLPFVRFASTIEIPFANFGDKTMTRREFILFGDALARVILRCAGMRS